MALLNKYVDFRSNQQIYKINNVLYQSYFSKSPTNFGSTNAAL